MTLAAKRLGSAQSSGIRRFDAASGALGAPADGRASSAPPRSLQRAPAAARIAPSSHSADNASHLWPVALALVAAGMVFAALAARLGFAAVVAFLVLASATALTVLAGVAVRDFITLRRAAHALVAAASSVAAGSSPSPEAARPAALTGGMSERSSPGAGFERAAFVRHAKAHFLALQLANDNGNLHRLRDSLTPAMFDSIRDDCLPQSSGAMQVTQVFGLDAQVVCVAAERDAHVVSVRFTGRVRGRVGDVPDDLDEVWHLTMQRGARSGWILAGIEQVPQPDKAEREHP